MSQDFKIQQNVKVGNDLINLRADNPDEFQRIAEWTVANAALFVNVQAALAAVPPALAGNVTNTQVINDAPAAAVQAQQQGQWAQPQQEPPSWSQPAQPAQGPVCQHGPMVYREGTGAKGPWTAHFCPTPKGTANQCQPIFGKR